MRAPLERLTKALGYRFGRIDLLEQALTHRSVGHTNNERLEFLGDALLDLYVAEVLYQRFEDADEGQLSRLRARIVKKESLAEVARELNLGDYLHLGAGELRSGGHARDSILADAVEAILAAVYLDGGMSVCEQVMARLFHPHLDALKPDHMLKDPKTRLQERLQAAGQTLPEYGILKVGGSQHAQVFDVFCRVSGLGKESSGCGTSRRKAEQQAAENMLELLEQPSSEPA